MSGHYGLEIGDKVMIERCNGKKERAEVIEFSQFDNNWCGLKLKNNKVITYPCEWCKKAVE